MKTYNLKTITDQKLFDLCKNYGREVLQWRQKFIGLLPEVQKRKLYEKKGFQSIFEFAKKLAGLSEEQIRTALNLDRIFEDKPVLKNIFINGEVSINKLVRITSVATQENQDFWANQVKMLSSRALETLVRDARGHEEHQVEIMDFQNDNGLQKSFFSDQELHVQPAIPQKVNNGNLTEIYASSQLQLSSKIQQRLLKLQQKGIDINQLLQEFLNQREQEIEREKEEIEKDLEDEKGSDSTELTINLTQAVRTSSRYIPARIKNLLKKEYGTKCSIPACKKPSQENHHVQRFSLTHIHDPHYLAPMCKEHHLIAHSIDVQLQQKRASIRNLS